MRFPTIGGTQSAQTNPRAAADRKSVGKVTCPFTLEKAVARGGAETRRAKSCGYGMLLFRLQG